MRTELDAALVNEGFESPELVDAIINAVKKIDCGLDMVQTQLDSMASAIIWAGSHL